MKINKLFLTASLALCAAFGTAAQTVEEEVTEYVFQPHWYVQGQVGMQETLGESSFGKLASMNAQLGVGYNFNSVLGARLIFNSWTSKGSIDINGQRSNWKWNYIAPSVNLTADLVNLIGGFNPDRRVNAGLFAGIGANIGYSNDQAVRVNAALREQVYNALPAAERPNVLGYVWEGTKVRFLGQFGVYADYKVSERVKLGIELQANVLPDTYNSKKAGNADWYFNGLVGVKYTFGSSSRKVTRKVAVPVTTQIVEKVVEVPVVKEVVKEVIKEVPAALSRDVFFKISTTKVTKDEMYKVAEIAHYLKDNPSATVTVTGYADKGTGSLALNLRLSAQRSQAVVDALTKEFGIAMDRITVKSMGEDEYQPYDQPALNRVAICVAK